MIGVVVGLLTVATVLGQQCVDIPPDTTFPCSFQPPVGGCNPPYTNLINPETGLLTYCLETCGLCDQVDLGALNLENVASVDIIAELCAVATNPTACAEGRAISTNALVRDVQSEMTDAIAKLTSADLGADPNVPVIQAAVATTEAVSTAVATAMSEVSLRGVTTDANSFANGVAFSAAEAIAEATAEAYSIAIAEAGDDFTELEASTFITDTQRALTSTSVDLAITGRTIASVTQTAYATAVAEAVANATARAFARITGTEQTAIALATAQAFNTSQLTCFSFCNTDPPSSDRTCDSYVQAGECGLIEGFCECACQTCSVGSEVSISTFVDLVSEGTQEQVISAMGEAFATGAAGADAVATVFVEAVAQGNAEAVSSAIAEAFGAQGVPAQAIVESIAQAINDGGDEVVSAVADGFAQAAKGGNANALATAISSALTTNEAGSAVANAVTLALSTAIADGECEAISQAITEAQAIADDENNGDANEKNYIKTMKMMTTKAATMKTRMSPMIRALVSSSTIPPFITTELNPNTNK
eukprot:TRINITY_DN437_c0_g1_i1.p1 TRINITY_DN437_c0_g1~~TRINITY_DN437_c0_g1_i1.p1  ORF type:complete len:535 (+),score=158.01 TRINITY_DN437_c0_g1_i1:466-2070(+)